MVLPGERVAAAEEYMSGPGTYESGGEIFAAVAGALRFNEQDKTVRVLEARRAAVLRPGDLVLGVVTGVSTGLANVTVQAVDGSDRPFSEPGAVHISKLSEEYITDARKEYSVGDVIRARVAQVSPSLQLSTKEPGLGALIARCGRCRRVLRNRRGKLYCDDCERQEHRKLAVDFARFTPPHAE